MRGRVALGLVLLVGPATVPAVAGQGSVDPGAGSHERLLVSLDTWPPTTALLDAIDRGGGEVEARLQAAQTLLVEANGGLQTGLTDRPTVTAVTPDTRLTPNLESSKEAVNLTSQPWAAQRTGTNVTVALVNGGVDETHPALRDRVVADLSVTPDGVTRNASGASFHGTHVAGILAGTGQGAGPDRGNVSGVAPGAEVVSLDISAEYTVSNALRAFEWIEENHEEHDIRVVLSSWGRLRQPAQYQADDPIIRASDRLVSEGLVVVFSAGNGGPMESSMALEATNPNVISVGAATDTGRVEVYSGRGPVMDEDGVANWTKPDLVAPGTRIVSTRPSGPGPGSNYLSMNGTSMAAPHVAGAAALILSERPELTPTEVKDALVGSATDVGPTGVDDVSGAGLLDVGEALERLDALPDRGRTPVPAGGSSAPAPPWDSIPLQASWDWEDPEAVFLGTIPHRAPDAVVPHGTTTAQEPEGPTVLDWDPTPIALGLFAHQLLAGMIATVAGICRSDPPSLDPDPHPTDDPGEWARTERLDPIGEAGHVGGS